MSDKSLQVIPFLLLASFLNDLLSMYLSRHGKGNFMVSNVFVLVETFLLYFYFAMQFGLRVMRKIIVVLGIAIMTLWIRQLINFGSNAYFNDLEMAEKVTILGLGLYFYYDQIVKMNNEYIYEQAKFWVVTAFFIYSAGTFFLILYMPTLSRYEQQNYYFLNYAFIVIRTILLSIAMFIIANEKDENRVSV